MSENASDDEEFNPLLDAPGSDEDDESADSSEVRLDLAQRMINLKIKIDAMEAKIEELQSQISERDRAVAALRIAVRRSPSSNGSIRNNTFIDACRRKFVEIWAANPEYLTTLTPEKLSFLGHLLHIPSIIHA